MIRILIVAGIRLYRDGLAYMLAQRAGFEVVGVAADCDEAARSAGELRPNVILVDLATVASEGSIRDLKKFAADIPLVALGVPDLERDLCLFFEAGIAGYVSRDGSVDELVAAVNSAGRGELLCSPRVAGSLQRRVASLAAARDAHPGASRLTRREREIVPLLEQDLSNKEIAVRLGIEVATVKNHVHNVLEKFQLHRRAEIARSIPRSVVSNIGHDLG